MGINLSVTIDVDNDGIESGERTSLTWSSLKTIPEIKRVLLDFNLKTTWFVRADNQLKDVYGSSAYLLEEHATLWKQLESTGDEIGWHPHVYEWDSEEKKYFPDIEVSRRVDKLTQIWEDLNKLRIKPAAARMGEAFHSNETMKTLNQLSLKVDASALPGKKRQNETNSFDWSITPNEPYFPSKDDYRIPNPTSHLDILEIPMTTAPINTSYDEGETVPFRYINPVYHHEYFILAINELFRSCTKTTKEHFLTITFHPDEVINRTIAHELYAFSLDTLKTNLRYLIHKIQEIDEPFLPVTLSEARSIFVNTPDNSKKNKS